MRKITKQIDAFCIQHYMLRDYPNADAQGGMSTIEEERLRKWIRAFYAF
jgi:hypothetical protein